MLNGIYGFKKTSAPLWIVAEHIRILNVIKPGRNPWMFKKDTCLGCPAITKGQLISECPFDVWNFPKKTRKILTNFCPRIWKVVKLKDKGTP